MEVVPLTRGYRAIAAAEPGAGTGLQNRAARAVGVPAAI